MFVESVNAEPAVSTPPAKAAINATHTATTVTR